MSSKLETSKCRKRNPTFSVMGGEGRKRPVVQPESVAAAGPGEPGKRRGAFLTLQLRGCQEASQEAARPLVFSILSWGCKTSLASSSPQESDDPSPARAPCCHGATSREHGRGGVSSPDPPLQLWGTGRSSPPCHAGRGPWSHYTYRVPHDQSDTAPCQSMPHKEGTRSPGPGGLCQSPSPAAPSLPSLLASTTQPSK